MFRIIFLIVIFLNNANAGVSFVINDICTDQDLINTEVELKESTLGKLTIELLNQFKVEYVGGDYGISSIKNSPKSDEALIVLSDYEMLAFGWCFKVDGEILEEMPDKVFIDTKTNSIQWYYGFAHYQKGEWISQCSMDRLLVKKIFCKK
jgi:hypothetical protein